MHSQPLLSNGELEKLRQVDHHVYEADTLDATFPAADGADGLKNAMERLCRVQKESRRSGGTKCCGNFLRYDPALAHPGYNYAAAIFSALKEQLDRPVKVGRHRPFKPLRQGQQSYSFCTYERCRSVLRHALLTVCP